MSNMHHVLREKFIEGFSWSAMVNMVVQRGLIDRRRRETRRTPFGQPIVESVAMFRVDLVDRTPVLLGFRRSRRMMIDRQSRLDHVRQRFAENQMYLW